MSGQISSTWTSERARSAAEVTGDELDALRTEARHRRDRAYGSVLTFSPKVFLPLTNLCRNRCDYCAFRRSPGDPGEQTLSHSDLDVELGRAAAAGCVEALFCLGDQPESAFASYRATLASYGHGSTVDYLHYAGQRALELGLLPHTNAGILSKQAMRRLRRVNASLGLMLECTSERLCQRGMPHHRAPDKRPARRLAMLVEAGELAIPFTTGLLVGIGETAQERVETLLAIAELHQRYGHIQEVIVQNFTPHAGTRMETAPEPSEIEVLRTVALARLVLSDDVSVQAPPNLNPKRTASLVRSGINDFGGISPVTPDFINPDRPWPHLARLSRECEALGFSLEPRLPIYDAYLERPEFLDSDLRLATQRARARLPSLRFAAPLPRAAADCALPLEGS